MDMVRGAFSVDEWSPEGKGNQSRIGNKMYSALDVRWDGVESWELETVTSSQKIDQAYYTDWVVINPNHTIPYREEAGPSSEIQGEMCYTRSKLKYLTFKEPYIRPTPRSKWRFNPQAVAF
jgi:hypothetical protein